MIEADISIDIHCGKLQEWLISRRIVPKNFQVQIRKIRGKIAKAINDMPENEELKKLLSGSHINYFHCKAILEILKQTEKNTKNVFGSYGSQRMKDWQEIVKLYEKDNVYLGEAAQILIRYQTYEIPGLWKQMDKCDQQSDDALKKVKELNKTENVLKHDHAMLCQQLGIKGDNLREELCERVKELPKIYDESIKDIASLTDAVRLYTDFMSNNNNNTTTTTKITNKSSKAAKMETTTLPVIRHLIKYGNTTVYEYHHKEKPIKIEENAMQLHLKHDGIDFSLLLDDNNDTTRSRNSVEIIDFGVPSEDNNDNTTPSTNSVEIIDFGVASDDNNDNTTPSTNSVEIIDFGDLSSAASADIQLDTAGDIDWGASDCVGNNAVEIDFEVPLEEYDILVEGGGMDGGIAKGDEAYTILDSPVFRDKLIDELYELHSFLKVRNCELNAMNASSSAAVNVMISLFDSYSTHDTLSIATMVKKTNEIILNICCEQTTHLYQLKHSSKYAELLISKLEQKLLAVEKIQVKKEDLRKKSIELNKQKENIKPIVNDLIEQVKILQEHIENDISKRYQNRTVNLMGGLVK